MEDWQEKSELRDLWLSSAEQLTLLPGMTDKGCLGFVMQLKFVELYGRFPEDNACVSTNMTQPLARQLIVAIEDIGSYDPCSHHEQRYRRTIQNPDYCG